MAQSLPLRTAPTIVYFIVLRRGLFVTPNSLAGEKLIFEEETILLPSARINLMKKNNTNFTYNPYKPCL
jgi:hypothetical protein